MSSVERPWVLSPPILTMPPAVGTSQTLRAVRLAALSGVATVYATHLPSGEICGSPTRCMEIKSSKFIARFDCAWRHPARRNLDRMRKRIARQ